MLPRLTPREQNFSQCPEVKAEFIRCLETQTLGPEFSPAHLENLSYPAHVYLAFSTAMLRGLCHQWNVECARYNEQINSRMRAGFATLGVTIDYEAPRGTIEETCPKESLLDEEWFDRYYYFKLIEWYGLAEVDKAGFAKNIPRTILVQDLKRFYHRIATMLWSEGWMRGAEHARRLFANRVESEGHALLNYVRDTSLKMQQEQVLHDFSDVVGKPVAEISAKNTTGRPKM